MELCGRNLLFIISGCYCLSSYFNCYLSSWLFLLFFRLGFFMLLLFISFLLLFLFLCTFLLFLLLLLWFLGNWLRIFLFSSFGMFWFLNIWEELGTSIWLQHLWNTNTVFSLVVLKNAAKCSFSCTQSSIEHMDEFLVSLQSIRMLTSFELPPYLTSRFLAW